MIIGKRRSLQGCGPKARSPLAASASSLTLTVLLALSLGACKTVDANRVAPTNLDGSPPPSFSAGPSLDPLQSGTVVTMSSTGASGDQYREVPRLTQPQSAARLAGGPSRPRLSSDRLSVTLPPQSVPEFINSIYGEILDTGYVLGPGVSELDEVISFRSANNVRASDLYESAANALQEYGVAIIYVDGEVRAVLRDALRQEQPRFVRSRARASVPTGMRPVVQFVDLYAIASNDMESILRSAFPERDDLAISENRSSNSLTLTGLPGVVDQALTIINQMDELRFAGSDVATLSIANWDVGQLSTTVVDLLTTEGYSVTAQANVSRAIVIRPIEFTQQLVVYATTPEMLEYTVQTIRRLDRDAQPAGGQTPRIYQARHYEAAVLAGIISGLNSSRIGGGEPPQRQVTLSPAEANRRAAAAANDLSESEETVPDVTEGLVVDEQGNRILFNATDEEYTQLLSFLRDVDTPVSEVLIEVTIAEVTLTDDLSYGVEALIREIGSTGYAIGTLGGLGLATGGLTGAVATDGGSVQVNFGASASNNQVNVLSTPRIVTKSGGTASIQVGTDVPIITAQSAGLAQIDGTTDFIQTVEYRKTGILLDVAPLVLSGDRIDVEISQEVSSAEANPNQAISSPIISNRAITSEITLQDGQTAILGGLIENRYTRGTTGVPFVKDIPILGKLFSTESLTQANTLLIVMVTPYILDSRSDRGRVTDALSSEINRAFQTQIDESETMRKPETPYSVIPRNTGDVYVAPPTPGIR